MIGSELGAVVESPGGESGFSGEAVLCRQVLEMGTLVNYRARPHVIVGITPMSVTPQLLELEDTETGRVCHVNAVDLDSPQS
jgi:hypothetical protein